MKPASVVPIVAVTLMAISRQASAQSRSSSSDSASIVGAVSRFHEALAAGDSATAMGLLSPGVIVQESGEIETRSEYLAHHLKADIEFAAAVPSQRTVISLRRQENVAWVLSRSTTKGTFKDRAINSMGAELMVLSRSTRGQWRIEAIHWSSRRTPQ